MINKFTLFTLFVFICLVVLYSNIFTYLDFTFEYQQISDIKIINLHYNFTNDNDVFVGKLKNGKFCKIDVENKVMIEKIINDVDLDTNKYYYTIINSNGMCSMPFGIIEIIMNYFLFYYLIIISSIITMIIMMMVILTFEYNSINENLNLNSTNNFDNVNYNNITNLYQV